MTGKSLLDQLKTSAQEVAGRVREGVEELQLKRELSQAYGELGRKVVELVESGELSHAALAEGAEKVKGLKAQLEALEKQPAAEPAEKPAEPAA